MCIIIKNLPRNPSSGETPSSRMTFVRGTDEDEKGEELDKVRLTESRRINWRPLNEHTPSTTIGQEKLTRLPRIQEPRS